MFPTHGSFFLTTISSGHSLISPALMPAPVKTVYTQCPDRSGAHAGLPFCCCVSVDAGSTDAGWVIPTPSPGKTAHVLLWEGGAGLCVRVVPSAVCVPPLCLKIKAQPILVLPRFQSPDLPCGLGQVYTSSQNLAFLCAPVLWLWTRCVLGSFRCGGRLLVSLAVGGMATHAVGRGNA